MRQAVGVLTTGHHKTSNFAGQKSIRQKNIHVESWNRGNGNGYKLPKCKHINLIEVLSLNKKKTVHFNRSVFYPHFIEITHHRRHILCQQSEEFCVCVCVCVCGRVIVLEKCLSFGYKMASGYCDFENVVAICQTPLFKGNLNKSFKEEKCNRKIPSPLWHCALSADSAQSAMYNLISVSRNLN